MQDHDRKDLERAAALIEEGRKLRARVLARIRQRTWRDRMKDKSNG
jgi:hypothetical protein